MKTIVPTSGVTTVGPGIPSANARAGPPNPVGSHGKLRTGVQIMAMRNREDLCLDAGEVIEAAEGVVKPIDPVRA